MNTYTTNALAHGINGPNILNNNWANRPDDEKFLSLSSMLEFKTQDTQHLEENLTHVKSLKFAGIHQDNDTQGQIVLEYKDQETNKMRQVTPTHWSFNQLASLAAAPSTYMRDLPAQLAAECMQWGLMENRSNRFVKTYGQLDSDLGQIRAATGPDYGRIYDHEVIRKAIDFCKYRAWKIPGAMVGSRDGLAEYNPDLPVTLDTTTLFASDRDCFLFLVDDKNPIEVGKLSNGDPDMMFRGFYISNSEVGAKSLKLGSMYLRGICMNRCLWGVENFSEVSIRHSKFALSKWYDEAAPALESFTAGNSQDLINGVQLAKEAQVAKSDEDALSFLRKNVGLSESMAKLAAARHLEEEEQPVRSVWDAAQAITAIARDQKHQDTRVDLEKKAGAILDKVVA